jgi:bifunctional enzyme CysN/CysC
MLLRAAPAGDGRDGAPGTAGQKTLLRFLTCGSVDDGKSTLIGRLLYECDAVLDDQLAALRADSRKTAPAGGLDLSLLVDGLAAEREQGITIDVAYRFFSSGRRSFIVADTPGHEQYTRNMVTGASTADLAILLLDARQGLLTQTRRHSYIAALLGIRHVVLAVNKMDLVGFSQEVFTQIERGYCEFAAATGLADVTCIPVSATCGDNVVRRSSRSSWYAGPTLLEHLEEVEVERELVERPFRLPVQSASRTHDGDRGSAGLIVSGAIHVGDAVRVLPSDRETRVSRIFIGARDCTSAVAGQSVLLSLADQLDVCRGDVIAAADVPPAVADQFEATVIWMDEAPMLQGRTYLMKLAAQTVSATVNPVKYKLDVNTLQHQPAKTLALNEIGVCDLTLSRPVTFEPYAENRDLGGFILIDRMTGNTAGCGLLHFALRRSHNVRWQPLAIDQEARARLKAQKPCVLWFTGLSGAGKSTIANLVEKKLHAAGHHTYLLDGDNVRHGLNKDLGFTDADRVENIRRVAEVARLMADAGLIVLVSLISPFRAERETARALMKDGEFHEIFIDAPLTVVEARDPKGLYAKARRGELKNFTGIDSPYERPEHPDIHIDTLTLTADAAAEAVLYALRRTGTLSA